MAWAKVMAAAATTGLAAMVMATALALRLTAKGGAEAAYSAALERRAR